MTRLIPTLALVLTTLLAAPVIAQQVDIAALREGDMKKLVIHSAPRPVTDKPFVTPDGEEQTLDQFQGQVVLLNFWATWCAPCRKEMPALDALNMELGGDDFQVVTIATGRNSPAAMRRFFEETNVQSLPLYNDPKQAIARDMAVLGLPITVVVDRGGNEIARLQGDADWNSDSAKAILQAVIDAGT
ncbi:TlpA disulfide reductase family protein [Meridianimarinicoccus aquatilis]|uniref:TlpA family protein disulfide reductase n=1 Tax=Meridianimarinicoccus aquatilis TaxID=2552766 RepID=A0A4R6AEQ8_9RHOB|nr:TlpA disulfide reductase family protein [Fluviibacterium aquatile]TDL81747.1 TlpA family protein disulfide reductase [Fluviibacterium aquatile]